MRWRSAESFSLVAAILAALATLAAVAWDQTDGTGTPWGALAAAMGGAVAAASISLAGFRHREGQRSPKRVFIIHAHEDVAQARVVAEWLRAEGLEPWLDVERISAGQSWKDAIDQGLNGSGAALVLISSNFDTARESTATRELRRAMTELRSKDEQLSPVIPVLLQDTDVPPPVRDLHAVSFHDEAGRANIRDGLRRVLTGR